MCATSISGVSKAISFSVSAVHGGRRGRRPELSSSRERRRPGGGVRFEATNLVPRDRNRVAYVYLHDVHTGQTTLVSRSARGGSTTGPSHHPALSADGRFLAFVSDASDLDCAGRCPNQVPDLNLVADVYLFDALTHAVGRVSGSGQDPAGGRSAPAHRSMRRAA